MGDSITIPCTRCGTTLILDSAGLPSNWQSLRPEILCAPCAAGKTPDAKRKFKVKIEVSELIDTDEDEIKDELLTSIGGEVEAFSFSDALDPLLQRLNQQWERVVEHAAVIDAEPADKA